MSEATLCPPHCKLHTNLKTTKSFYKFKVRNFFHAKFKVPFSPLLSIHIMKHKFEHTNQSNVTQLHLRKRASSPNNGPNLRVHNLGNLKQFKLRLSPSRYRKSARKHKLQPWTQTVVSPFPQIWVNTAFGAVNILFLEKSNENDRLSVLVFSNCNEQVQPPLNVQSFARCCSVCLATKRLFTEPAICMWFDTDADHKFAESVRVWTLVWVTWISTWAQNFCCSTQRVRTETWPTLWWRKCLLCRSLSGAVESCWFNVMDLEELFFSRSI